jgi:hypothetical protein
MVALPAVPGRDSYAGKVGGLRFGALFLAAMDSSVWVVIVLVQLVQRRESL